MTATLADLFEPRDFTPFLEMRPLDVEVFERIEEKSRRRRVYIDEHTHRFSRVWLVGADFGYGHITFRPLDDLTVFSEAIGEKPDWLGEYVSDVGWDSALDASPCRGSDEYGTWLMEQGIAPGQPFCVEVTMTVTRSGWEYVEYDQEVEADVIEVARWSRERVAAAWEKWAKVYCPEVLEEIRR